MSGIGDWFRKVLGGDPEPANVDDGSASNGQVVDGADSSASSRFDEAHGIGDSSEVRPVTVERIGLLFDSEGWKWDLDDEGDLASGWDSHMFYFRLTGEKREVLNVMVFRRGPIGAENRSELLFAIEDWHRDHLWPKCYFREAEGDSLQAMAELNVDLEMGATDEQLLLQCRCAIATSLQFFEDLDKRFGRPDDEDGSEASD
ncbi:type III secretion system chaperone family protein [Actinomyces culturomici]|uniref:YbjN domain-containing protein n=1 Tax=Actinomyces culturomici TaxID=1926276 RepID=UPI000E2038A1|nr:YbjN domain-containing protein [Actinomyces culturomici]